MLSFPQAFDYYQAVVYPQRGALASSVAALISELGAATVLDCACGTGLPGIDLRAMGVSVECSDADPGMLGQFAVNAAERGVDDKAHQLPWRDLCLLGRQFGLVMCRGNSLVYADSWEAPRPAAGTSVIEGHLEAITSAVAPGGYLLVDAPRTRSESSVTYPEAVFRGERVTVSGTEHRFTRYSADLTGQDLAGMLSWSGLAVTEAALEGERPSYLALLARKPG